MKKMTKKFFLENVNFGRRESQFFMIEVDFNSLFNTYEYYYDYYYFTFILDLI